MEKNKRNKIIGLSIGILIVLIIVVSSTYAYWQITKTQKSPNDIVAACLSLDLKDASTENTGIDLDSAWPISDEEGKSLAGYTFTVTNNCAEEINYIVGLNRVEASDSNYLLDSSIKLQLDDNSTFLYSDLSDVEYADAENTEYTARTSKQVSVETIGANTTNTHTIRVWISENAPVTEQSKTFLGQVFITGGQGIEVPECYTIADNGIITGYNYECGLAVKVPAEINGIQVKEINSASFTDNNTLLYSLYNEETAEEKVIYYYTNENTADDFISFMKQDMCEDSTTCTLADIESMGILVVTTEEEYNAINWDSYTVEGPYAMHFNSENGEFEEAISHIKSMDLSEAVYLETIGDSAFLGKKYYEENDDCEGEDIIADTSGNYCLKGLKKLILPEHGMLKNIGQFAFDNASLGDLVLPHTVEVLSNSAFASAGINNLVFSDTEDFPSQLTIIPKEAFYDNKLTKVVIPASIKEIKNSAFTSNPNLTEVIIKNTEGNVTIGVAFPSTATITYNPN